MINEFPGDHTVKETPDPIPNSVAKLVRPMIVNAKVGDCQEFIKACFLIETGLFLCAEILFVLLIFKHMGKYTPCEKLCAIGLLPKN